MNKIKIKQKLGKAEVTEISLDSLYLDRKIQVAHEVVGDSFCGYVDFDIVSYYKERSLEYGKKKCYRLYRDLKVVLNSQNERYQIFHNFRDFTDHEYGGLYKYSYHVIFPSMTFQAGEECKNFMLNLFKDKFPYVDDSIYVGNSVNPIPALRLPYFQKYSSKDILQEINIRETDINKKIIFYPIEKVIKRKRYINYSITIN